MYFKVLQGNQSQNGGSHAWDLPKVDGTPGDWQRLPPGRELRACEYGFHITQKPAIWFKPGSTVYVCEIGTERTEPNPLDGDDGTKFAVRECRLMRVLSAAELNEHGIYTAGEHTHTAGKAHASGTAVVTASGSAQVKAYGSAQVTASGSAQVTASGSAQVTAYGSAQVTAYGSAQVKAYDSVTVVVKYHGPKVTLEDRAAEVSWASGWAEFRTAAKPKESTCTTSQPSSTLPAPAAASA